MSDPPIYLWLCFLSKFYAMCSTASVGIYIQKSCWHLKLFTYQATGYFAKICFSFVGPYLFWKYYPSTLSHRHGNSSYCLFSQLPSTFIQLPNLLSLIGRLPSYFHCHPRLVQLPLISSPPVSLPSWFFLHTATFIFMKDSLITSWLPFAHKLTVKLINLVLKLFIIWSQPVFFQFFLVSFT